MTKGVVGRNEQIVEQIRLQVGLTHRVGSLLSRSCEGYITVFLTGASSTYKCFLHYYMFICSISDCSLVSRCHLLVFPFITLWYPVLPCVTSYYPWLPLYYLALASIIQYFSVLPCTFFSALPLFYMYYPIHPILSCFILFYPVLPVLPCIALCYPALLLLL